MRRQEKHSYRILTAALCVFLFSLASLNGSAQSKPVVEQAAPAPNSAYAGADNARCHEDQFKATKSTRHWMEESVYAF